MRALIRMNGFDVHERLDSLVLQKNAVAAHDVASHRSDFTTVGCAGSFCHSNSTDRHLTLIIQTGNLHDHENALLNESHTFHQLCLNELPLSNWLSELLAGQAILEGGLTGTGSHTCGNPGDKDPGVLEDLFRS